MKRRTFFAAALTTAGAGCLSLKEQGTETASAGGQASATPTGEAGPTGTVTDGATIWSAQTMSSLDGAPTLGRETVYVHSSDRRFYALERASGDRVWRTEIGALPTLGAATVQPLVTDELILTVTNNGVVALDREDGGVRWSVDSSGGQLAGSPIAGSGVVVHSAGRRRLSGISRDTGDQLWELQSSARLLGGAAGSDGEVCYVLSGALDSTTCRLRTIALADGTERRTTTIPIGEQVGLPSYVSVADGVVVSDIDAGGVTAFDHETGERLWRRRYGDGVTPPLTVANGTVYLKGFPEQEVGEMAVNLQTGSVEWEITPDGSGQCCSVAPAVASNRTYIANTADAGLVGVDATGDIRWRYEGAAVPAAKPAVTDESLYIPAEDGRLYHLRL